MTGEQKGLRFDIYERVQLQEPLNGLEQLDSIELIPQIKVLSKEEQAVLKGHLTLSGSYTVSDDRDRKELVHYIPVEITLPLSRITSLEDLKVDIEHFDVDLISPHSLSVTGVLSLEGIEMVASAAKTWGTTEEVFVSQSSEPPEQVELAAVEQSTNMNEQADELSNASDVRSENVPEQKLTDPAKEQAANEPVVKRVEEAPLQQKEAPKEAAPKEEAIPIPILNEEPPQQVDLPISEQQPKAEPADEIKTSENAESNANLESLESIANEQIVPAAEESYINPMPAPAAVEQSEQEPPKKKEMKIAFGSKKKPEKKESAEEDKKGSKGLKSLLHKEQTKKVLDDYKQAEEAMEAAEQPADAKNGLEWKKLFLHRENEEQSFKKVKMCIVQKEETLNTIAEKYGIHPRELLMYNRLSNEEISEGQVVYIPN